jgi:hypothetical protein
MTVYFSQPYFYNLGLKRPWWAFLRREFRTETRVRCDALYTLQAFSLTCFDRESWFEFLVNGKHLVRFLRPIEAMPLAIPFEIKQGEEIVLIGHFLQRWPLKTRHAQMLFQGYKLVEAPPDWELPETVQTTAEEYDEDDDWDDDES